MKAIWKRETQGYFYTPVGYVFLGVFLAVSSVMFYLSILSPRSADLPSFIARISYMWMLLSPVLTMRLLAEERQKKTDQLLLTSPVSLRGIVFGKYLAAVTVLVIASLLTILYAVIVAMYGRVYPAELAVNYLGFILLGCAFAALDLFLSSCAATPVTAAVMAFGANFFLWILDLLELSVRVEWIGSVLKFISLYNRNEPFLMGQLSFASVFYDLAFIAVFLMLTIFRLDRRRTGAGIIAAIRTRRILRRENEEADGQEKPAKEKKTLWDGLAGSMSLLTVVMITGALILLSVTADTLEKRNGWRADYSFNSIATHSDTTKELLRDLPHDVHIYALFRKGYEDAPLLELLDRYAAENHRITWEQVDPAMNPELVRRFSGVLEAPEESGLIISCEDTGRWRLLGPEDYVNYGFDMEAGEISYDGLTYERSISRAIYYVTRDRVPRVVIMQGHGERDADVLATFENLLTLNHYEVTYRDLSDPEYTPDPQDLLVFFSPQKDLTESEYQKAETFADLGGSFLFTIDSFVDMEKMPNYTRLLQVYGFQCLNELVYADKNATDTYYEDVRWLLPDMLPTDITKGLILAGMNQTFLPNAVAFDMPAENDPNFSVVLQSGGTSRLGGTNGETGPFALALQNRRTTEKGYITRAFVIGNSEAFYDEEVLNMSDSPQLLIRVMEYLLDLGASNLDIMEREAVRPSLGVGSVRLGSVLLTALPAAVLLAALLVLARRRRR